jgi:hypothetical protein
MAIISRTIRVGQKPPKEILEQAEQEYKEAKKHPPVYDPECPPLGMEALAEFHPINGMTWEERSQAMREAGILDLEDDYAEEAKPQGHPAEAAVIG